MTLRRAVAAMTAAAIALLAGAAAAPAQSAVVVTVFEPIEGATYEVMPWASGRADGRPVERIELRLADRTSRQGHDFACGVPELQPVPGNEFSQLLPTLACNGEYELTATAVWTERGFGGAQEHRASNDPPRRFVVAIPPVTPSGVRALVDEGRGTVTLRWDRNPEGDIVAYEIERSRDGGEYRSVGEVEQPARRGDPEFVDDRFPVDGEYSYRVKAVRLVRVVHDDLEGTSRQEVRTSAWSASASVQMAATPVTTTTVGDGADGGEGGGAVSGGATSRHQSSRPASPPTTRRQVYLGQGQGYRTELDYGVDATVPAPGDDPVVEGEAAAPPPGSVVARLDGGGGDDPSELLLPVAGGLVLLVGALQLRYLLRQASRPSPLAVREPASGPPPAPYE